MADRITRANRIVNITVSNGRIKVDHNPVHICRHEQDQVVWRSNREFVVDFGARSPFRGRRFFAKNYRAESGPPGRRGGRAKYKYSIRIQGARPLDPGVQTDP